MWDVILKATGETLYMTIAGICPQNHLVEAVENHSCDFFVAVQFHPEFKSRPNKAHPLFRGFVAAALKKISA